MAVKESVVEPKVDFMAFFSLLLKKSSELSDEEISQLLAVKEQLARKAESISRMISTGLETVQRYRQKKKEFGALSTKELQKRQQKIINEITAIIRADVDDDLDDSFYEAPPIDSDEHVLYELLEERKNEQGKNPEKKSE